MARNVKHVATIKIAVKVMKYKKSQKYAEIALAV